MFFFPVLLCVFFCSIMKTNKESRNIFEHTLSTYITVQTWGIWKSSPLALRQNLVIWAVCHCLGSPLAKQPLAIVAFWYIYILYYWRWCETLVSPSLSVTVVILWYCCLTVAMGAKWISERIKNKTEYTASSFCCCMRLMNSIKVMTILEAQGRNEL